MIALEKYTSPASINVIRIVESQEKAATMALTSSLEEQAQLEDIIETCKPAISAINNDPTRHYLLTTPFRYPPLKHGSRFGSRVEPSIFYASYNMHTALSESAFYAFYFMSRSLVPYTKSFIVSKTSFVTRVSANQHVDLTKIDDRAIQTKLTAKTDYQYTQTTGSHMRKSGADAFSYYSARCDNGKNMGIFHVNALSRAPKSICSWEVKQTPTQLSYLCSSAEYENASFNIQQFLVDGELPLPSS